MDLEPSFEMLSLKSEQSLQSSQAPAADSNAEEQVDIVKSIFYERLVKNRFQGGSEGRPVDLLSNFFKIKTSPKLVNCYVVDINKVYYETMDGDHADESYTVSNSMGAEKFVKALSSTIFKMFVERNEDVFGNVGMAYNGDQKLYTTKELNLNLLPEKYSFEIQGKMSNFVIKLTLNSKIDLGAIEEFYSSKGNSKAVSPAVLSVVEQIFRNVIEERFTYFQKAYYTFESRVLSKFQGFELVKGFTTAVRLTEFGLALNIHTNRSACVISQHITTVSSFIQSILNLQRLDNLDEEQVNIASKFLKGLKIETTHTGKRQFFIIDSLSNETSFQHTFTASDGSRTTVRDHFQKRYNIPLLPLNLVITTAKRKSGKELAEPYKIHLPMEACFLVKNQFMYEGKLTTGLQTELIKLSSSSPNKYFANICKFAELIKAINPKLFRQFGIELTTLPAKVPARVLEPPPVLDKDNLFYRVADLPDQWAVFCYDHSLSEKQLNGFIDSLKETGKARGMIFENPFPVSFVEIKDIYHIFNCFDNLRHCTRVRFTIFILPSCGGDMPNGDIYNTVKYFSDSESDFISQCVRGEKVKVTPKGYFENLLDKINMKIGGMNTVVGLDVTGGLPFEMKETMLVGIDVNHPGQFDKVKVSLGAVVGSRDEKFSAYTCNVRGQKKFNSEAIEHIDEMVEPLMSEFRRINRKFPKNIIIFRDGVSDSYLGKVLQEELAHIEAALRKLVKDVRLAFIVVLKSHSARFGLPRANTTSHAKPTYNVEPGTVVDSFVIEPAMKNMYLNSHFSFLGTSKLSRYLILRDDFSMTADQLEKVCFFSCHNCARTRRSISIPVPIYYAHLCALRAMLHLQAEQLKFPNAKEEELLKNILDSVKLNCTKMYYV